MNRTRGFERVTPSQIKVYINTTLPTRGTKHAAGYDFYSKEEITLKPNEKHVFWSDVKSYMQVDEVLLIDVRSSIGIKKDLQLGNTIGVIDSDYYENPDNDGNIAICLRNVTDVDRTIAIGERIAQGIFVNYLEADNIISEQERKSGLGSTNNK